MLVYNMVIFVLKSSLLAAYTAGIHLRISAILNFYLRPIYSCLIKHFMIYNHRNQSKCGNLVENYYLISHK